jgi:hypothetical protein
MAKKIDEAEVKKECPSCGLGVALDSTVCEFCGWDFEEEDEWILQIEKLERELMLEKQKFEPGSVEGRIASTLHSPSVGRIEMKKVAEAKAAQETKAPQKPARAVPVREAPSVKEARLPEKSAPRAAPSPQPAKEPVVPSAPAPVREAAPPGKVRRVRTVKAASAPAEDELVVDEGVAKRSRLVRKVKM